eukprot:1159970-Pelagomonas_calceolata.AAC.1
MQGLVLTPPACPQHAASLCFLDHGCKLSVLKCKDARKDSSRRGAEQSLRTFVAVFVAGHAYALPVIIAWLLHRWTHSYNMLLEAHASDAWRGYSHTLMKGQRSRSRYLIVDHMTPEEVRQLTQLLRLSLHDCRHAACRGKSGQRIVWMPEAHLTPRVFEKLQASVGRINTQTEQEKKITGRS